MRLTVGPLPSAVYWRRRAIVLGGALVVLFVIFQACSSSQAPGEQARTGSSPSASAEPAPEGSLLRPTILPSDAQDKPPSDEPAPDGDDLCTDDEMLIEAESDRSELPAGESVQFTIWIRNDSDRTCRRDVGGDVRELYLRQGSTTVVWSSRHCDPPEGEDVKELAPGFVAQHYIEWNGRLSDSCQGVSPTGPVVEAGEYELVARLGTDHSEPVTIVVR